MLKNTVGVLILSLFLTPVLTIAAGPSADVRVSITGPNTAPISVSSTYNIEIKNGGSSTANNIALVVDLPLTNTSPVVRILGNVSVSDSRCSVANNKITCQLGSLKNNKLTNVSFGYTPPVSSKVLEIKATVSSSVQDSNLGNNVATIVPNLVYPSRVITSANILNSHCTGQGLTSYFECLISPSSISSHSVQFLSGGTINLNEPGYTGTWSQPTNKQLRFEYLSNGVKVLEFDGYAINGENCFDGMSTFFPQSNYVSPYHVCIQ